GQKQTPRKERTWTMTHEPKSANIDLAETSGCSPPTAWNCVNCVSAWIGDTPLDHAQIMGVTWDGADRCYNCLRDHQGKLEADDFRARFLAGEYDRLSRTPHLARIKTAVASGEFILNGEDNDDDCAPRLRAHRRIPWFHYESIVLGLLA